MAASYALADSTVKEMSADLISRYHTDMDISGATVDILFAFRDPEDESGKPAIEKEGKRVLGMAKILSLKDRVKGMADCEIIIDGDAWGAMDVLKQKALLDHELEHFEVKRDKNGNFVFDDINRPVLKMRPHDRIIRFFDTVAQRHTSHSIEAVQLRGLFLQAGQTYLPFVPEEARERMLLKEIDSLYDHE